MDQLRDLGLLAGRICLAALFIYDATVIVGAWQANAEYLTAHGVPSALLPLAALFQFLGGVILVIGYRTALTALAFAAFCVATAVLFHFRDGNMVMFAKDIALAGGFLVLAAAGAGRFSADAYRIRE